MELSKDLIEGTIFEELVTIIASGDFASIDTKPEGHEETVGTMNDLERGLYTLVELNSKKALETARRLDGLGEPFSSEEQVQLKKAYAISQLRAESARNLLWNCIKERLHEQDKPQSSGWGIRSDFRIVLMFEPIPRDVLSLLFGR